VDDFLLRVQRGLAELDQGDLDRLVTGYSSEPAELQEWLSAIAMWERSRRNGKARVFPPPQRVVSAENWQDAISAALRLERDLGDHITPIGRLFEHISDALVALGRASQQRALLGQGQRAPT
jgi:hypothetical protein